MLWKTHSHARKRSLRLFHRLTASTRTHNPFSQNCLPCTDTDEGERAGWEVGDTVWKTTTGRSDPPLSQPGAFQASVTWLTDSCSRLCAELSRAQGWHKAVAAWKKFQANGWPKLEKQLNTIGFCWIRTFGISQNNVHWYLYSKIS